MQRRNIGIVITGIGIALAVVASIWLTLQPGTLLSNSASVLPVVVVFVVVFALMVVGGYMVLTTGQMTVVEPEMEAPLQLLDALRGQGEQKITILAQNLGMSELEIEKAFDELIKLKLFSGYFDPQRRVLCSVLTPLLQETTRCAVCSTPLVIARTTVTTCSKCSTQYALI